jgi:hypothetical protein
VRRVTLLILFAALLVGLLVAAPAAALPANPWTGRWLVPKSKIPCNDRPELGVTGDQVFTATQTGPRVTFNYTLPGGQRGTISGNVSADGATLTAGAAPDGWTEGPPSYCFGTGHGSVTLQMAPDARSFTTTSGSTDFGNGIDLSGTYQGGGTEPRTTALNVTRPLCPGGPFSGIWNAGPNRFTITQSGSSLSGDRAGSEGLFGTITENSVSGKYTMPQVGVGTFTMTLTPDGNTLSFVENPLNGGSASGPPEIATFGGCGTPTTPAPNLQTTIPAPQTLTNGPTSLVAPGKISLRSLKRSKCVLVKVASSRPARVLVSIFSGRLSIRLFGQKLVVFFAPGRQQPCIPVPLRAHTFNVRTPLKVALGYTAGTRRQRGGRKPRPVIKPISLVP